MLQASFEDLTEYIICDSARTKVISKIMSPSAMSTCKILPRRLVFLYDNLNKRVSQILYQNKTKFMLLRKAF